MASQRRAGVLVPLFSLRRRSSWGCGDVADIPAMARWAASAGLSILQLLPVHEAQPGGDSPYAAMSAFALDPVVLAIDELEDFRAAGGRAALPAALRAELAALDAEPIVRWGRVRALKRAATRLAFERFVEDHWRPGTARAAQLRAFVQRRRAWLDDVALFSVIHERRPTLWLDWPAPLRDRDPAALAEVRQARAEALLERAWLEWQLDEQWHAARDAAAAAGVSLMGDLPFVVALDSADVWAHRDRFRVDLRVGTPPDAFSATGQDWGLPAYDWDALAAHGYDWLRARAARAAELTSSFRVDHVIGLYRTFVRAPGAAEGRFVPADEPAQVAQGERVLGIFAAAGEVIAEDLGTVPRFLPVSLARLGIPGYRVLRWEKDEVDGAFRDPATWPVLSLATNGTHDTDTTAAWYDGLPVAERVALARLPGLALLERHPRFDDAVRDALLAALYAAPSALAVFPLQDLLGHRERVNVPGTLDENNWAYRMPMTVDELAADAPTRERLAGLARASGRAVR